MSNLCPTCFRNIFAPLPVRIALSAEVNASISREVHCVRFPFFFYGLHKSEHDCDLGACCIFCSCVYARTCVTRQVLCCGASACNPLTQRRSTCDTPQPKQARYAPAQAGARRYADTHACSPGCPTAPCTCARWHARAHTHTRTHPPTHTNARTYAPTQART